MKLPNEYVTMLEEHCEKLQEVGQKFGLMIGLAVASNSRVRLRIGACSF
jgi:hypothetical protein